MNCCVECKFYVEEITSLFVASIKYNVCVNKSVTKCHYDPVFGVPDHIRCQTHRNLLGNTSECTEFEPKEDEVVK